MNSATKQNDGTNGHLEGSNGHVTHSNQAAPLTAQQFEDTMKALHREPAVKTLGSGIALGLLSFIMCLLPVSCVLLELRGTTGNGVVSLMSVLYGHGAAGLIVAAITEWIAGNTFTFTVFFSFGSFWAALAIRGDPLHSVGMALERDALDLYTPYGFYYLTFAIYVLYLTIAALRVNIVFVALLFSVFLALVTLGAGYISLGDLTMDVGTKLVKAGGGFGFAASVLGLYALWNPIMASTRFPVMLPMGDLSGGAK
ncbi:unnamed protein product [Sympodiomycopsis kandeliae]